MKTHSKLFMLIQGVGREGGLEVGGRQGSGGYG